MPQPALYRLLIHRDTLNGWLRRAAQEDTETTLEADDYTLRELRALAKTTHVPGYGRLRKADLATAIAAKPSEYSVFSAALKKAEAEAHGYLQFLQASTRRGRGNRASVPAVLAGHKKGGRDSPDHRLAWPPPRGLRTGHQGRS